MKPNIATIVICFAMASSTRSVAQSGPFVDLGTPAEERLAVTGPPLAMRVGNGVLLRSFSWKPGAMFASSGRVLASCRGRWLSDMFDEDLHEATSGWTLLAWQQEARKREIEVLSTPIEFKSWATSDLELTLPLRAKLDAICKAASAEPRNVFLPVSSSVADKNGVILVSAIVSGTAVRKENIVDVWIRTSEFKVETMKVNNEPFVVAGVEQKRRVANGNYDMKRSSFDCKNRQLGTYQIVYYKSDGTNTADSIDRRNLRLSDVTPNSVGEAELESVCMLYGPIIP